MSTTVIQEIYEQLALLDEFSNTPRSGVQVEPLHTLPHSEVYRVRLATPATSLILKRPGASDLAGLADRERRFYRNIAPLLPRGLVPKCVLAVDTHQGGWLLIEDLAKSHLQAEKPTEPTYQECRSLVAALATLHGFTSTKSAIREEWTKVAMDLPGAGIDQRVGFFLSALDPFLAMLRESVDRTTVDSLSGLGKLSELLVNARPTTKVLVHGDAHFGNALYSPVSGGCLIDWGMPMVAFGEIDLAHALALNLPRHIAREWESEMVRVYLDQMAAYGSAVDVDSFYQRYRLGVLYSFVSPVVWWRTGVPDSVWWPALNNCLDAAHDLGLMS